MRLKFRKILALALPSLLIFMFLPGQAMSQGGCDMHTLRHICGFGAGSDRCIRDARQTLRECGGQSNQSTAPSTRSAPERAWAPPRPSTPPPPDVSSYRPGPKRSENWAHDYCQQQIPEPGRPILTSHRYYVLGYASHQACMDAHYRAAEKKKAVLGKTDCDAKFCYPEGRPANFPVSSHHFIVATCKSIERSTGKPVIARFDDSFQKCEIAVRKGNAAPEQSRTASSSQAAKAAPKATAAEPIEAGSAAWAQKECMKPGKGGRAVYLSYNGLEGCIQDHVKRGGVTANARPAVQPQPVNSDRSPKAEQVDPDGNPCLNEDPEEPNRQYSIEGKTVYRLSIRFTMLKTCKGTIKVHYTRQEKGRIQKGLIYVSPGRTERISCLSDSCSRPFDTKVIEY